MSDTDKNGRKLKVAIFTLGDVTFITRFHRNVASLREMGFEAMPFSVKPRTLPPNAAPYEGVLINGWTRRLRGRFFGPLRTAEMAWRFFWSIWRYRPDVLFAHNLPALILARIVCAIQGQKTILFYDAMELESGRSPVVKTIAPLFTRLFHHGNLERLLAKRAAVITSADFARTRVMAEKLARPDIVTIRNVPQFTRVPRQRLFHKQLGLAEDTFIFLYQGIVIKGRGIEQSIRSLRGLPEKIVFIIMGMCTESYKKSLEELAQSLGLSHRIFILPAVPSNQLLNYTASADVIHSIIENTCLSYYLAAPNKLYEAAMAGIPVIASRFPEMEAVLTKYPYGILISPESTQDIAAALLELYQKPALREQFGCVGLEAAKSELNWEKESQKLKNALVDAIG
jgi:glycosyltransferase involved in cell wall biosynthesis